jgi:hypothetical protein
MPAAVVAITAADPPPHPPAVPPVAAVMTPFLSVVIDGLDCGLAVPGSSFHRRGVQFVEDAVRAGYPGNGIDRPYGGRDGGGARQAEYRGEECSSVHWILQLSCSPETSWHARN